MPYATPRPMEDDAWRVHPDDPGTAHFYGWSPDFDGEPKCQTGVPFEDCRRVDEGDTTCAACDAWYLLNVSMPWLA